MKKQLCILLALSGSIGCAMESTEGAQVSSAQLKPEDKKPLKLLFTAQSICGNQTFELYEDDSVVVEDNRPLNERIAPAKSVIVTARFLKPTILQRSNIETADELEPDKLQKKSE